MKQYILLLACLMFAFAKAQVSTSSATPTADEAVTILFDATGTPLENTSQTIHLYAGVTINGQDFQKIKGDFFDNDPAVNPTFTRTGQNTFSITLGPTLNQYFEVDPASEVITAVDFVIRNATGSNGNNPVQTQDFSLPIFPPGLNAVITAPANGQIIEVNTQLNITAASSRNATLDLSINGTSIGAATGQSNLDVAYTFATPGSYEIVFTAIDGNDTASDQISTFVPAATQNQTRPSGLKNGVNENTDGSVTFLLAAPNKSSAFLIGDFNDWTPTLSTQMKKDGDYFWVTLPATEFTANTQFSYQYIVDQEITIADPYSTLILDPGNDQFIKPGNFPNLPDYPEGKTTGDVTLYTYQAAPYNWTVDNFQRPDANNLVIYELLVRDFSDDDSFQAVIDKIDYLDNLGINAVEFMPVNEFEGASSWGYNPKFHGALDKAYGSPDKFKELVDLLHSRGIAVIVDVVYNQAAGQSPLVQMWADNTGFNPGPNNPYLNQTAKHPFNVFADFNHESAFTKEYVKQTMQYFIEEFRLDGFRFDLSKGFTQRQSNSVGEWNQLDTSRLAILEDYRSFLVNDVSSDLYLILEHLGNDDEEKILADSGFMLWGKMTDQYAQNSMGFASNSNLQRAYFTSRGFNDQNLVSYAESHDEERLMYSTLTFGNTGGAVNQNTRNLQIALDRQEAIAAIQYSIPGPKMLWQFGELGYDFQLNDDRLARKPIPFEIGYDTDPDRQDLYNMMSEMIKLKIKYPETFNNTNNFLNLNDGLVKRIYLNGPDFDVIVLANFDIVSKQIAPQYSEQGTWYDHFAGTSSDITNVNSLVTVPAGGYKVLTTQSLSTTASAASIDASVITPLQLYPNPTTNSFKIDKPVKRVSIHSITGQLVKEFEESQALYDISDLATGLYIIEVYDVTNNRTAIKLVKQ